MSELTVGGQAVMEGVMMRTPHAFTVAVRAPDGSIVLKDEQWRSLWEQHAFLRWPFFRGTVVMVEALVNGMQALTFAASVVAPEEEEAQPTDAAPMSNVQLGLTLASSFLMAMGMFVVLPHALTYALGWLLGGDLLAPDGLLFHAVDGVFKLLLFVGYIAAISMIEDIRRVFQYHGAEHKSVYAYEAGVPLTVENARRFSTLHPRCGTSFLMFVMLVSIFLFSAVFPLLVPKLEGMPMLLSNLLMIVIKLPLMLPVAGIAYEAIRFSGRFPNHPVLRLISRPGIWMQNLTTREPTDDQLEVALTAMKRALERESAWQQAHGAVPVTSAAAS